MSEIEYVMREIASDRDNLNGGLQFSNGNGPVFVEPSVYGTYEYDSASGQESTSDTLDDDTRELKKNYINKSKKVLFLGSIILLIILGVVLLGITKHKKHALSENSLGLDDGELGKAFLVRLTLRGGTCTASIIGDNWLLTAGHCIEDLFITDDKYDITRKTEYGDLKVYMTDTPYDEESFAAEKITLLPLTFDADWTRPLTNKPLHANATNKPKKYWRRIESIIMHNKYKSQSLSWQGYDIALIHLEPNNGKEVPEGKMLPACLPSKGFDDENNHTLFAAGYGWRRYPHCLTNMEGPEKFQTCGREFECTKEHRSRYCPMNFTDQEGSWHNSCITDSPTPSASSNECQSFHARRPDLKNTTVHLFSLNGTYERTCYALFSNNNGQKGWCTTRKPGVFVNQPPTEDSGWGYCSNDTYLEMCGEEDFQSKEDDTPFSVSFLPHKNCFEELKENLAVEQPQEVANHTWFKKMVDDSDTFCVGQILQHSFENEKFVFLKDGVYHDYANYDYLIDYIIKPQIYSKSKAQRTYFDGGPGCFGDSGGPLWREVYDEKSGKKVPVIVGVLSFLLWGTCHGAQSPKYYGKVAPITDWIKQYVPENQICEYSKDLKDSRQLDELSTNFQEFLSDDDK